MQSNLSQFQRQQLALITRVTPYAMAGHILNTTILAIAVAGTVPLTQLIIWCIYSYSIALLLLYRHLQNRGRLPYSFQRAAKKATIYAFFLALPWSSLVVLHLGALSPDREIILVALGTGMAASGTILLSAVPPAAFIYMSGILIPSALKCLVLNQKSYLLLGVLALSCWGFLAALIAKINRDIGERKKTELALAERNMQLALAGKAALVGSYSYDTETERVQVSEGYAAIHGFPEGIAEIARSEWEAGVHPGDIGRLKVLRSQAFHQRQSEYNVEYRIVRSGGESRWLEGRSFISYGSDGRPRRVVGVNIDVTERKQAEQALADRNAQLEIAGKTSLVGSFMLDIGSGRLQVSPGYAVIHGFPDGTVEIARGDWRAHVHPDDQPRFDADRNQALAERRREHYSEYRIVRSCGEIRWIESRSTISYDHDGCAQRMVGVNIDVTERKQAEVLLKESDRRLADALEAGQVMAFEWDAVTGLSQRSDNAAEILGFGMATSPRKHFLRQVHPDDRARFRKRIRELQPSNPSYALNFRYVCPGGREVWLEETAKAEFDAAGRLLRIKGLTRDISERMRAEKQQGLLAAELDHRAKNILAMVSVVVSLTQEASGSMADFVTALDGRIRSMATTHELLSHHRWQGIPLAELVHRELAPYATASNLQIEGADEILSAQVGQAIAMVLHELATNAAKYGAFSARGGHVSVRWSHKRNGNAKSWLSIRWEESGGPSVVPPTRSGFGTSTICDLIPYELGGTVDLVHAPEGVRCTIEIPDHRFGNSN